MKAKVHYNDFVGSVAADVSDVIAANKGNYISGIGEYFNVDQEKFKVIGVSLTGIYNFKVTLICVDKQKSTPAKDHVVRMNMDLDSEGQKRMLDLLFKRLNFVLFDAGESNYDNLVPAEEVDYNDYHTIDL